MESYSAGNLTIEYDASVCTHAGRCVKGLGAVFNPKASPWINPSAAPTSNIIEVIGQCPSGALRYYVRDKLDASAATAA